MTKIKICGITSLQDALEACNAGADALGFNFSTSSPRMIDPEHAKAIVDKLPPFISSVGIFVDQSPREISELCRFCRLDIAQLHNEHYSAQQAQSIKEAKIIKVFRPEKNFDVAEVFEFAEESGVNTFLFDAYQPGIAGGTGKCIGTSLAACIIGKLNEKPVDGLYAILAGGLNDTNVGEAIRQIRPYGVDTASGVEKAPGIKDAEKIKAFIRAVRQDSVR